MRTRGVLSHFFQPFDNAKFEYERKRN